MTSSSIAVIFPPPLPQKLLLGLDTLALTPSSRFLGLKNLGHGWHFIYAGSNASLSLRTGYWVFVPNLKDDSTSWLRVFKWDTANEVLEPSNDAAEAAYWQRRLDDAADREMQQGVLPFDMQALASARPGGSYDQEALPDQVDFPQLTSHVTPSLLARMTGAPEGDWNKTYIFSTSSSSPEDRDDIPGLSDANRIFTKGASGVVLGEERELSFLGIDLKRTWKQGAVGRERTIDAQDRSGALERIVETTGQNPDTDRQRKEEPHWGAVVIGELQVTFLMVLLLANWSCLEEWKRLVALVLTCRRLVPEQPEFFLGFVRVLRLQLQRFDDVEGGLFDISGDGADFLKKHLRDFRKTVKETSDSSLNERQTQLQPLMQEMLELEEWVSQVWKWNLNRENVLKRGMVQLEDGESLELQLDGFEADDETGEYAPVVVDLGEVE